MKSKLAGVAGATRPDACSTGVSTPFLQAHKVLACSGLPVWIR